MIDGQNVFDQPVGNNLIAHDSIQKIATGQGKCNLNSREVFIFKALIYSNISHDEFTWINNVLKNMTV